MTINRNYRHPKIFTGETILSWVSRGLSLGNLENPHLFRKVVENACQYGRPEPGAIPEWPVNFKGDLEFDDASELFSLLSDTYGMPAAVLGCHFRGNGLLLTKFPFRNLSCEDCLAHSFVVHKFPVWRKDWCYVTTGYCPMHFRALTSPRSNPSCDRRMWDCYLDMLWRGRSPVISEDKRLALLALKAQVWVQKITIRCGLESDALYSLYGLLLSRRTFNSAEGIAASGFGYSKRSPYRGKLDLHDRLDFGMHTADGAQRGGALLLIGWLFDLYPDKDVEGAIRGNRKVRRTLPRSPELLGTLASRVCSTREEGVLMINRMLPLNELGSRGFADFLNAFKVAAAALR